MQFFRFFLFPLSIIYFCIIKIRHILYDYDVLKSCGTTTKTISVGNLKMGGTGKTPFINMLVNSLADNNIALLSRGYGRTTKGFVLATNSSATKDIGDEPKMLSLYNPTLKIAVCENRVEGVKMLSDKFNDLDIILLDDAMQHRAIKPTISIMLTEYDNPYYNDYLFPVGWLRDLRSSKKRADIIVVTKSPKQITLDKMDSFVSKIKASENQRVFFTTTVVNPPCTIYDNEPQVLPKSSPVVVVSAIASCSKFVSKLSQDYKVVKVLDFKDHHRFTQKDINLAYKIAKKHGAVIVFTAKDRVKIEEIETLSAEQRQILYVQDISFKILDYRGANINTLIFELLK